MGLSELCIIVVIVIAVIVTVAFVIDMFMRKLSLNNQRKIERIYLGKLENSDTSIQKAMNYLKLTNSIVNQKEK